MRVFVGDTPNCVICGKPIRELYAEKTDKGLAHANCAKGSKFNYRAGRGF